MFSYFPPESICSHEKRRINILNTSFEFLFFLLAVVFISFAAPILRLLNIGLNLSLSAIILTCVSDKLIVGTAALPRPVLSTH
jgi:hypothetical protein